MPKSLKKLRSNRAWIERHINDPFVKKSRREGYRARSVYKLTELDIYLFHAKATPEPKSTFVYIQVRIDLKSESVSTQDRYRK